MGKSDKIKRFTVLFCVATLLVIYRPPFAASAEEDDQADSKVIVSLGDSYSSGEGIEPFYGQEERLESKVKNYDWLAHRSKKSWPGMLTLPTVEGTMADHRDDNWYFVAASGAEICHLKEKQKKSYNKFKFNLNIFKSRHLKDDEHLPRQFDVFKKLEDNKVKADYVTLTLGGNDLGFVHIVKTAALNCMYLDPCALSNQISDIVGKFPRKEGIGAKLRQAYRDIAEEAGPQAKILVAGYPHLFDPGGKGLVISRNDAQLINNGVSFVNKALKTLVGICRNSEKINIWFVSVEEAFKGHEAYSWPPNPRNPENTGPFINRIYILPQKEEREIKISEYSVHPNEKGARAYAACVQSKINELEKQKKSQQKEQSEEQLNRQMVQFKEKLADLTEERGAFDPDQSAIMKESDAQSKSWFKPKGIMSGVISDFDMDKIPELLVCYTKPLSSSNDEYAIWLEMYELDGESVVLSDKIRFAPYCDEHQVDSWNRDIILRNTLIEDCYLGIHSIQTENDCVLLCEALQDNHFWTGYSKHDWGLIYRDRKFQYLCAYTQTSGGSMGFEYTGYDFSNGKAIDSNLYYSQDWNMSGEGDKPLFSDYDAAKHSYFSKYGIDVCFDGYLKSYLTANNNSTVVFEFKNFARCDNKALCSFKLGDMAHKNVQFQASLNSPTVKKS